MKFSSLLAACLTPFCAAADVDAVKADIANISSAVTTLDGHAKGVLPGILGVSAALTVEVDAVQLHDMLESATLRAEASAAFGASDTKAIVSALSDLGPKVVATLNDVVGQRGSFGDLGVVVRSCLLQLSNDTDAFAAALVSKVDPASIGSAPDILKSIDAAFSKAVTAYKTVVSL